MWNELAAMLLVSALGAGFARGPTSFKRWIFVSVLMLVVATLTGTLGVALVGIGVITWVTRQFSTWAFLGVVTIWGTITLSLNSGQGRILGLAEATWMAWTTNGTGVGWGQWVWHQAEAQRAVLQLFPFEKWKVIAPYFSVAPSLPAHLLAEVGILGLLVWVLALVGLGVSAIKTREKKIYALILFLFVFILMSAGTTPIQSLLMLDRKAMNQCDGAFAANSEEVGILCPQIRALEWTASLNSTAANYQTWHATFPSDVMPMFALGRLAAIQGDKQSALRWMQLASMGNPKKDRMARLLAERAKRMASGDDTQLKLWAEVSKDSNSDRPAGPLTRFLHKQ